MYEKLLHSWNEAAIDLELQLVAPFSLSPTLGVKLDAIFLIKNFGGTNGMLIFGSYNDVSPYITELIEAGYGFSILDEPPCNESYRKSDFIEVLADWGWSGDEVQKPTWLHE